MAPYKCKPWSWFVTTSNAQSSASDESDNSKLGTSASRRLKGVGMIKDSLLNPDESNGITKATYVITSTIDYTLSH